MLIAVLCVTLVIATVVDIRERRIPNVVTGGAAVAAITLGTALDPAGQTLRTLAAASAMVVLGAVRAPRPEALGLGDVKLAGAIGLCLGPTVVVAVLVAFLTGALTAIVTLTRGGVEAFRAATVPFAPYLAFGSGVAALIGSDLLGWYLALLA